MIQSQMGTTSCEQNVQWFYNEIDMLYGWPRMQKIENDVSKYENNNFSRIKQKNDKIMKNIVVHENLSLVEKLLNLLQEDLSTAITEGPGRDTQNDQRTHLQKGECTLNADTRVLSHERLNCW